MDDGKDMMFMDIKFDLDFLIFEMGQSTCFVFIHNIFAMYRYI